MDYLLVAGGLTLLVLAGDALVRGAVAAALKLSMSPLLIGATIVAVGTSAPELVVGIDAVLKGAPTLALGNVVGSNTANILLAIGLPAIILPASTAASGMARTTLIMLAATAIVLIAAVSSPISWPIGLVFLVLLALFVLDSMRSARRAKALTGAEDNLLDEEVDLEEAERLSPVAAGLFLLGGLLGVIVGADMLVDGAVSIAMDLGVSEAVIGLTLVAVGTSLPELATALVAAYKGHADVAIGNVIGSNIFNLLGIIGASSLFGDIPIPASFWAFDFWVMVAASLAILPFCLLKTDIGRFAGAIFFAAYCGYIWLTAGQALKSQSGRIETAFVAVEQT
ncbi:MAG: calcium/sodium antiporter [Sphingomonadales bacterium]